MSDSSYHPDSISNEDDEHRIHPRRRPVAKAKAQPKAIPNRRDVEVLPLIEHNMRRLVSSV